MARNARTPIEMRPKKCKRPSRHGHAVNEVSQTENEHNDRDVDDPTGDKRCHQQRRRRNGRHFEASQNVSFTLLHGAQAGAEQPVPQDAHDQNQRHHIRDRATAFGPHETRKDEEEDERKEIVEENHRLVAKGELQIHFDKGQIAFHL